MRVQGWLRPTARRTVYIISDEWQLVEVKYRTWPMELLERMYSVLLWAMTNVVAWLVGDPMFMLLWETFSVVLLAFTNCFYVKLFDRPRDWRRVERREATGKDSPMGTEVAMDWVAK